MQTPATLVRRTRDPEPSLTLRGVDRRVRGLQCSTILAENDSDRPSTNRVTFVLIFRIPTEGVEDFRAYEEAVLPLLPEFNGRLERRLRNPEGTVEMHIVSYTSDADRQNYRNDPRRAAQAWLLEKSSAKLELLSMADVS